MQIRTSLEIVGWFSPVYFGCRVAKYAKPPDSKPPAYSMLNGECRAWSGHIHYAGKWTTYRNFMAYAPNSFIRVPDEMLVDVYSKRRDGSNDSEETEGTSSESLGPELIGT